MNISLKLWRQRVLRSSQPMPPAPTRRARVLLKSILANCGDRERCGQIWRCEMRNLFGRKIGLGWQDYLLMRCTLLTQQIRDELGPFSKIE